MHGLKEWWWRVWGGESTGFVNIIAFDKEARTVIVQPGTAVMPIMSTLVAAAARDYAKRIDTFLINREQSVLSKLIAIGGVTEGDKPRVAGQQAEPRGRKRQDVNFAQ